MREGGFNKLASDIHSVIILYYLCLSKKVYVTIKRGLNVCDDKTTTRTNERSEEGGRIKLLVHVSQNCFSDCLKML
jgi:hypothetical protein